MNDSPRDHQENSQAYLTFVERLADEFQISVEQILPLYERELTTLRSNARFTAYLSVLTTKHVRDVLYEKIRTREQ